MKTVKVEKQDLLERVQHNRDQHRQTFIKAQEVYREKVVELLDQRLEEARNGGKVNLYFGLPTPEDHTDDYDNVIAMLEMSVEDQVELTAAEFSCYVRDEWGWRGSFAANTASYVVIPE